MALTFQRYPKVSKQCCSQSIAHTTLTPITLYKLTQSPFYAVFLLVDLTSKVPYFCRKCRGGKRAKFSPSFDKWWFDLRFYRSN